MNKLVIASRASALAMWQSKYIAAQLSGIHSELEVEIKVFKTQGDAILDVPLAKIGGKGLFTKELEDAILRGEADLAVHSLKDVPTHFENGLILSGVTKRADRRDALLSCKYASIDQLPRGAVVGTASLRRRMQLLRKRPDLIVKSLRGNVPSRIEKLKDGLYDAIVLAYAGLERLDMTRSVQFVAPIDLSIMLPAMGQGVLGLESKNNAEILALVKPLIDKQALVESTIERDFIDALNGSCQVPIGVCAELFEDQSIYASAIVGLPNGKEILDAEVRGDSSVYTSLGKELADKMLAQGARGILKRAELMIDSL
ncbi:porphobilinogen deaminase [Campylobacterota bacterium]|nr:porphobilinogen deaminase [Campylobacterota bacterium]